MANNTLTTSGMSADNVSNLPRLTVGMNQRQVLRIMRHPHSQETHAVDCDIYDVWFYVTRTTALDQSRMVPLNLTPLTFKNGVLIGWGYDHYRYIFRQQEKKKEAPPPAPKKKEDAPIEKTPTLGKEEPSVSMSTPPKKEKDSEEDSIPLDEDDDKMLEESDEQNFDFW